jgi:hypothetical protein
LKIVTLELKEGFIDLISAFVKVYENGSTERPQLKLPLPDAFKVGKKEYML